jgi:C4-dicarboxylate transporter, DctM subunit
MLALILVLVLLGGVGIGVPIAFALATGSIVAFAQSDTPLLVVAQQAFSGLNNFVLLAVVFFVFTGAVMETGGISLRITNFVGGLVGWMRGGLGMVDIVSSLIFADISGSATADTAAIGSVMIPGLLKRGYSRPFAAALQAASGSLGLLFPPSISMVVYAYVTSVSVSKLFLASFVPGFLVASSYMVVNYILAVRKGYPAEPLPSPRQLGLSAWQSALALVTPFIILGGILGGVFTPPEAGAVAALYALILTLLMYRSLTWPKFVWALRRTVLTVARVTFLFSMSLVFGLFLTRAQIPQWIAQNFLAGGYGPLVLLAVINLIMLLIHTSLDAISTIIVIVPILIPVLHGAHIDLVHFGIILLVNSAIGIILPPVGMCLYISCSLTGVPIMRGAVAVLPFAAALFVDLAIVTLVPELSLALPRALGM